MYLKKIKSRKQYKRTTSKIKHKRLYTIKKGGANISMNSVMSDEAMHLYIGDIEMDKKVIEKIKTTEPKADIEPKGIVVNLNNNTSDPNFSLNNNDPHATSTTPKKDVALLAKIHPVIKKTQEFNIERFMNLLDFLCNSVNDISEKANKYSQNPSFTKVATDYLQPFVKHSTKLVSIIYNNQARINKLDITNTNLNTLSQAVFENKKKSNTWIILLKDILVDIVASISESIYVCNFTEEKFIEMQNIRHRKKNITNIATINEIKLIDNELIKKMLNDIVKPIVDTKGVTINYAVQDVFDNIDKPISIGHISVGGTPLLRNITLDICIIEILFDLLREFNDNFDDLNKKIQIIKNDLLSLEYVMNKINERVLKELNKDEKNEIINNIPPPLVEEIRTKPTLANSTPPILSTKTPLVNNSTKLDHDAKEFLESIKLIKYAPALSREGFNDIASLIDEQMLDDATLKTHIGMSDDDVRIFRKAVNNYNRDTTHVVNISTIQPNSSILNSEIDQYNSENVLYDPTKKNNNVDKLKNITSNLVTTKKTLNNKGNTHHNAIVSKTSKFKCIKNENGEICCTKHKFIF